MGKKNYGAERYKDEPRLTDRDGGFAMLPEQVTAGERYQSLSFAGRALLVEVIGTHNGWNNGYLPFSVKWARTALNTPSDDTASRACNALLKSGLVKVTMYPRKGVMRRVALNWYAININTENGGWCPVQKTRVRRPLDDPGLAPWMPDFPERESDPIEAGPHVGSPVTA